MGGGGGVEVGAKALPGTKEKAPGLSLLMAVRVRNAEFTPHQITRSYLSLTKYPSDLSTVLAAAHSELK